MTLITFVIPVRHQDNARDWGALKERLGQTVRSIANQDHPDWLGVIVANEGADLPDLPEKFSVVRVNFPPNDTHERKGVPREVFLDSFRADKGRRVLAGMLAAGESRYFMICDDDDFVSSRIAGHVAAHDGANGWVISKGYLWDDGGGYVMGTNDFNHKCGTCLIVRSDLYGLPDRFGDADLEWIKDMFGSHHRIDVKLAGEGTPLDRLPFRGAVYRMANAGSHSRVAGFVDQEILTRSNIRRPDRFLLNLARIRPLGPALRREFFGER